MTNIILNRTTLNTEDITINIRLMHKIGNTEVNSYIGSISGITEIDVGETNHNTSFYISTAGSYGYSNVLHYIKRYEINQDQEETNIIVYMGVE